MKLEGRTYTITYNNTTATVSFQGVLRLQSTDEGKSITDFLNRVAALEPKTIQLDFEQLQLMNSTGLSILTKFLLKMRGQDATQVILRASKDHFWQQDLIKGLQRFLPGSELEWV
jgi:hypothetical protein